VNDAAASWILLALLAVPKLTKQASWTVWVAVEVKVFCKTDVLPVAPDSRVFVVAGARWRPLAAVISVPPSLPAAPQLPLVAPKDASPAASVTALPDSAMKLIPQVADGKHPFVTLAVVPWIAWSIHATPELYITLWTELQKFWDPDTQ
jgi:hypothetical protein